MKNKRVLDNPDKRKCFSLWLSEGEKLLLEAKAEQYNYSSLGEYIRDASIYENLIYIEMSGCDEMKKEFSEYSKAVNKYIFETRRFVKYSSKFSEYDQKQLLNSIYAVVSTNKSLKNAVLKKLNYNIIECNAKEIIKRKNYNKGGE